MAPLLRKSPEVSVGVSASASPDCRLVVVESYSRPARAADRIRCGDSDIGKGGWLWQDHSRKTALIYLAQHEAGDVTERTVINLRRRRSR